MHCMLYQSSSVSSNDLQIAIFPLLSILFTVTIPLGQDVNPTVPQVDWYQRTNFSSFGPWGLTSGCTTTCSQGMDGQYVCKRTTKWPYGMCTLKVLQEPTKPEFWSQDPGTLLGYYVGLGSLFAVRMS